MRRLFDQHVQHRILETPPRSGRSRSRSVEERVARSTAVLSPLKENSYCAAPSCSTSRSIGLGKTNRLGFPVAAVARSGYLPDSQGQGESPPCRTPHPPHRLASGPASDTCPTPVHPAAWYDRHSPRVRRTVARSRVVPVRPNEEMALEVMHAKERDAAGEGQALAVHRPTRRAPTRPGPAVTAMASIESMEVPALSSARSTTETMVRRWARLASSGTTPPNTAWISWERMTRLSSDAWPLASDRSTAADVSSQDDSMASRRSIIAREQLRIGARSPAATARSVPDSTASSSHGLRSPGGQ